ncbi:MAG: class I SAM-dependent methyltransferase [Chitinophagaceae bacterium]
MPIHHYDDCPLCHSQNIAKKRLVHDHSISNEVFEIWSCQDCTLLFTQNAPDAVNIAAYYGSEEYISHSETKKGWINQLYHQARRFALLKKQNWITSETGLKTGKILDIGAGTGSFLRHMQKCGWQVTGVEPDQNARENSFRHYGLTLLSAEELFRLGNQKFEVITLWHVLEHIHDLHPYLEQIKNLLSPGGRIFIAVPNYQSLDARFYQDFWAAYDVPRHLYHFSPLSMKHLLKMHDLRVVNQKSMLFDSFYISLLSEKYLSCNHPHYLRGMWQGFKSMVHTSIIPDQGSSMLYIVRN